MDIKSEIGRIVPLARAVVGLASGAPERLLPVDLTVLFTDIDDYASLTERLGDRRAHRVVRTHNRIVREALAARGGVEVKQTGDGIMAYFLSASQAVGCAIDMQRAVEKHNRREDTDPLRVAVGINTGAPVHDGGDIFGSSVNIAARLADRAEGGQVLVADVVRQLCLGKGHGFSYVGEEELDGLQERVRLFEVRWREEPDPISSR